MAQLYSIVSCWSKTCFLLLSWLVNKNHNLQGWQIPAGRWNSERERGFPQVAMSCSQNLVQFWRTCHCRGLTMEEARNLLRSCQGEVSSSHYRIIWNIYHQLWINIVNFYLNSQCPGNYGHHHYFTGGYHHSQRPRERASGTNCAGEFPMNFFFIKNLQMKRLRGGNGGSCRWSSVHVQLPYTRVSFPSIYPAPI